MARSFVGYILFCAFVFIWEVLFFSCGNRVWAAQISRDAESADVVYVDDNENILVRGKTHDRIYEYISRINEKGFEEGNIYFGRVNDRGIGYQFVEAMTIRLLENRHWVVRLNDSRFYENEVYLPEASRFDIYDGEFRDYYTIRRNVAVDTVSSALSDTFEKTPVGSFLKELEQEITSMFTMEYSRIKGEKEARFYLPGRMTPEKMKKEKEYHVKLSSLFYLDSDTINGEFSIEMDAGYKSFQLLSLYDIGKKELTISMTDTSLCAFLGMDMDLQFTHTRSAPAETTGIVRISLSF